MIDSLDLSIYELGIINNALRNQMMRLEDAKNYMGIEDEHNNNQIDVFSLELVALKQKIRDIISDKSDKDSL
ncbi:hypothetical protein [Psychrobacter sp. CAL346-MNA-CIBAN-0220]|uniref:hypothetical protein n=1 Tax=Psychrobacter sp. CAL346-MNA-CIBAN-0220 TaxID=3140457 RepID=UPI00332F241B